MPRSQKAIKNANDIIQIVDSQIKTATSSNIIKEFEAAGIFTVTSEEGNFVQANVMYARYMPGICH